MNLIKFALLFVVLAALTWWLGDGIQSVKEENTQEDVLGNSLNAAKGAAQQLGR